MQNAHRFPTGKFASYLLPPKRAAAVLGVSVWTLARMRARGLGPAVVRYPGTRRFFYALSDLDDYIASQRTRQASKDGRP